MLSLHPVTAVSCCHICAMQHAAGLRWRHCCILQSNDGSTVAMLSSLTMEALLPCCPCKDCCLLSMHPVTVVSCCHICAMQHAAAYDGSTVAMLSSLTIEALLPCCPCTLSQLLAVVTSLQCSMLQSHDGSTVAMLSSLRMEALLPCCPCTLSRLSAVVIFAMQQTAVLRW
jgi:hypothetical protein